MKNNYEWVSLFREKRFLQRFEEKYGDCSLFPINKNKQIVVMLDVRGTLDNINDELAKAFMEQLHYLRIKFNAQKALIIVSSYNSEVDFKEYLDILKRNLKSHIELNDVIYLHGTYDYNNDLYKHIKELYNSDKFGVFRKEYISESTNWVGIFDNDITFDKVKELKDFKPMALFRPSQYSESDFKDDCLMCYSTMTQGFIGVVETLNRYIAYVKTTTKEKVFRAQKNYLVHLSAWDFKVLCIDKNFDLLLRYLEEQVLDITDYELIIREMEYHKISDALSEEELMIVNKIIEMALSHIPGNEGLNRNLTN